MREYKIVVLGAGGVGKSAIFIQGIFVEKYDPTIEDSYRKAMVVGKKTCVLEILDTAGTEQFTAIRDLYMSSGNAFLLVYSVSSMSSYNEISEIYEHILRVKGSRKIPIVLAGNKCDLDGEKVVTTKQGLQLAHEIESPFYECSAKKGYNITQIFQTLVKQVDIVRPQTSTKVRKVKCFIL